MRRASEAPPDRVVRNDGRSTGASGLGDNAPTSVRSSGTSGVLAVFVLALMARSVGPARPRPRPPRSLRCGSFVLFVLSVFF